MILLLCLRGGWLPAHKPAALTAIQEEIGDCTRCPLAYAGRRKIVFADGDPNARLMFVGEGPGADEDTRASVCGQGGAAAEQHDRRDGAEARAGLHREYREVPAAGEPGSGAGGGEYLHQFLLKQIDVVQPEVIVALGATAATYLLGVKQSLAGLRGRWHSCRGAKLAVTYHPAFLLRDPRQKGEAWKDLQMVMKEMGLKAPAKG